MQIGPSFIVACPKCKGLGTYTALLSGEAFGARVWTDGKEVAPTLPRPPAVVKCRHCDQCYWLSAAEKVGSIRPHSSKRQEVNPAWAAAETVQEPTEDQYHGALTSGLASGRVQERVLRVSTWWRGNDPFRDGPVEPVGGPPRTPGKWVENLEVLVGLLDKGDENAILMKAEALRELGQFEAARRTLDEVGSRSFAGAVGQIRGLCDEGDTWVRELRPDEGKKRGAS